MRYAIVRNGRNREDVEAILPGNYEILHEEPKNPEAPHRIFVILGNDEPGAGLKDIAAEARRARMLVEEIDPGSSLAEPFPPKPEVVLDEQL